MSNEKNPQFWGCFGDQETVPVTSFTQHLFVLPNMSYGNNIFDLLYHPLVYIQLFIVRIDSIYKKKLRN